LDKPVSVFKTNLSQEDQFAIEKSKNLLMTIAENILLERRNKLKMKKY